MDDKDSWDSLSEFTLAEILEMENMYKEIGEETLNKEFCQKLATNFSCSSNRMGKSAVKWQQVQIWFQEKLLKTQNKHAPSSLALKLFVDLSDANSSNPGILQRRKGTVEDLKELSFEARSSKDFAWYDVESFLNYRVLSTGELEVRVRFTGFDKREDEWVNVDNAVRERSVPLEPSECHMVKIGDLVLCYQTQGR
ncbi:protein SAWADEE HOMEODOMAIN HOMOLOG 1 isoform X2 [Durio zibethinus]|uniref:Protein SAWADEE HOMEODOMAIN HOMOLOG 1 isoform X2 n=1 Tax=Durio zibethinus TaxID=66656 RepID=A0A6P5X567_DURZI|nr:protein SAWADEE HOMEODOMAIN HOMOLOG 1 isoform X2 [Durio zibethinus]